MTAGTHATTRWGSTKTQTPLGFTVVTHSHHCLDWHPPLAASGVNVGPPGGREEQHLQRWRSCPRLWPRSLGSSGQGSGCRPRGQATELNGEESLWGYFRAHYKPASKLVSNPEFTSKAKHRGPLSNEHHWRQVKEIMFSPQTLSVVTLHSPVIVICD